MTVYMRSERNYFLLVKNKNVTREYLCRDGLNMSNDGAHIFACNLFDFISTILFSIGISD